jgi:hypothetical protein
MNRSLAGRFLSPLRAILVGGLVTVVAVAASSGARLGRDKTRQVLSSDLAFRRVIVHEGSILLQGGRGTTILRYSTDGAITGGADISTADTEPNASGERTTLYDIALGPGGGVWALVGTVHPETGQIGTYIFKYPDLSAPPATVRMSKAIAAFKLAVDSAGNIYLLGLAAGDFHRLQESHLGGEYHVVHKFTANGEFLGTYLPILMDGASEDSIARSFVSPIHQAGNFAVDSAGNAWVVWFDFPQEHESLKQIPSEVYRVDTVSGLAERATLQPPVPGSFISGVLQDHATGGVLFEWRKLDPAGESFLTSAGGEIIARGAWRGRVVGILGDEVLTTAAGMIQGKRSLLREPLVR